MYAHYTSTKILSTVLISRQPSLRGMVIPSDLRDTGGNFVTIIKVSGKAEARSIADRYSAVCWNF